MKLAIFSHHFVNDFVKWNFANLRRLNPTWDVISIGFDNYNLLQDSLVVDKSIYPSNSRLAQAFKTYNEDWCDPDFFLYEAYRRRPNYDGYFLCEYDTVGNTAINDFFDTSVDFFGNNISQPVDESWYWVEQYRRLNDFAEENLNLATCGQLACVYASARVAKLCYEEVTRNKRIYDDMLSELRLGTIVSKFCKMDKARMDIRDYIWWERAGLRFGRKKWFYHPVKTMSQLAECNRQ
jgi:hypothetical protein